MFFSNFRGEKPKEEIAIAAEKDPGTPHSKPVHGFKMGKKTEPNRNNVAIFRKVTLFGLF